MCEGSCWGQLLDPVPCPRQSLVSPWVSVPLFILVLLWSSSTVVFGWFSHPRGAGRAISSCESNGVAVPWAGAPAPGSKQCLATVLALELDRAEGLQNTGEALPGAFGISGWKTAALEMFRVQGGQGEDALGATRLATLQLPAIHTGSIPSPATLEGAGAAFFTSCAFTHRAQGLERD